MSLHGTTRIRRRLLIIATVLGFHILGIWALQSGLVRHAVEQFIPVHIQAELMSAPEPTPTPALPEKKPEQPRPKNLSVKTAPQPPRPLPTIEPAPVVTSATSPTASPAPAAPATTGEPAPPSITAAKTTPAPAVTAQVELPSSNAEYLNNPRPPYPALSKRLGEQGKVVLRVFIETNGSASRAEIRTSSGFERLDETAMQTVLRWRFIPGKRNGVPEAMWFNVPIAFVLE